MKTFILDADHNITAYTSQQQVGAMPQGDAFTTAAGLKTALRKYPAATAVEIWNSLTGVTPVKKFKDADTAARRIFAELQKLDGSDSKGAPAGIEARRISGSPRGRLNPPQPQKPRRRRQRAPPPNCAQPARPPD